MNNIFNKKKLESKILPPTGSIYDKYGQLQQTWKTQPAGNKDIEFFDKVGHLQHVIAQDGTVMNKFHQKTGKIKPGYDDDDDTMDDPQQDEDLLKITARKIISTLESIL
jgi:hypothetical protein